MMTKDAVKVGHGHAYNANAGLDEPDLDYVAMGENGPNLTAIQSEYVYAAQTLTGTITQQSSPTASAFFTDRSRALSCS